MSILYNRISELCNKKGITGYRLCKDIGISPNIITELRLGHRDGLSAKNADKIASYFGVSVGYLLGTEPKEKSPSKIGEGQQRIPDEETLKLLELLETREDIRYLAAASARATPEHVKATAKMFDELYGRNQDK